MLPIIENIKNVEVKPSPIHGMGLFATKKISKHTLLCKLQGQRISREDYLRILKKGKSSNPNFFVEKYSLGNGDVAAMPFRTHYSYINHDDKCSIYSSLRKGVLYVYASKDIQENEEITDRYNLNNHIDVLSGFS